MPIIKKGKDLRERIRCTILTARIVRDAIPKRLYFFKPGCTYNSNPNMEITPSILVNEEAVYSASLPSAVCAVIESIDIFSTCTSEKLPHLRDHLQSSLFTFKVGEKRQADVLAIKDLKIFEDKTFETKIYKELGTSHLDFKYLPDGTCGCIYINPLQNFQGWIDFIYPGQRLGNTEIEITISLNGYVDLPVS